MFGCTRPHQSGQEEKHEAWVLETLNFLHRQDIPFYSRDGFGDRVSGGDKEIPERLKLVDQKVAGLQRNVRELRNDLYEERQEHAVSRRLLNRAEDMLERLWVMLENGDDNLEAADIMQQARKLLEERRPYLFEEDEEENDDSNS